MLETVGTCAICGETIDCRDGFLNGVVTEQSILCFSCAEHAEETGG
jgi:hypothetical protein